jgi:hypothetical protein
MAGLPDDYEIPFEPNLVITRNFFITNSDNSEFPVVMSVEGDLKEYVTISENEFILGPKNGGGGAKAMNFTLSLPEWIPPGQHRLVIYGMQKVPEAEKGIVARLRVGYVFFVFSPYPGRYIEFDVKIENAKVNETINFMIDGISRGNESIQSAQATFYIYDAEGNLVTSLSSDRIPVEPGERVNLTAGWLAKNAKPGKHKLVAELLYDGNRTEKTIDFMIGSPTVKINGISANPIANGTIGKITVGVASEWDEILRDMYIVLDFRKGDASYSTRSKSFDLGPFKEDNITVFWDTSNSGGPGEYSGLATLYYLNKTHNATFYVEVAEPGFLGLGPDAFTMLLIAIIAVLIAMPIVMLVLKKKGGKGAKQTKLV